MHFLKYLLAFTILPLTSFASDVPQMVPIEEDNFSKLLAKQARLAESEIEAKIRSNNNQGILSNSTLGNMPANATPLLEARQEYSHVEPVLEAIWGIVGKEVAELNYKGKQLPVSMQDPYISKIDGWKLESITPYSITLIKMDGKRVQLKKTITLDWHKSQMSNSADGTASVQVN